MEQEKLPAKANPSTWSYSRTSCFGRCKYEFYLNYIVNDDDLYLSEGNYFAEVGSLVHEILAMIFENKLKPEEAETYFRNAYKNNVFYQTKEGIMKNTFKKCADYFRKERFEWLNDYEILGVELEERFSIQGHDFVGFIDLLLRDRRDGKIVVLDHKSAPYPMKKNGEVKKNQLSSFNSYKKQMYLYCNAVYQQYGEYPKEIVWNHFKEDGQLVKIPFVMGEYEETLKWFIETIELAEKEEDYEPTYEFFYCSNLCNFRNSCEFKKYGGIT